MKALFRRCLFKTLNAARGIAGGVGDELSLQGSMKALLMLDEGAFNVLMLYEGAVKALLRLS